MLFGLANIFSSPIRITERFANCGCVHYIHAIDICALAGRPGHAVSDNIILVGYNCPLHEGHAYSMSQLTPQYPTPQTITRVRALGVDNGFKDVFGEEVLWVYGSQSGLQSLHFSGNERVGSVVYIIPERVYAPITTSSRHPSWLIHTPFDVTHIAYD